jgi:hypothetical protein
MAARPAGRWSGPAPVLFLCGMPAPEFAGAAPVGGAPSLGRVRMVNLSQTKAIASAYDSTRRGHHGQSLLDSVPT